MHRLWHVLCHFPLFQKNLFFPSAYQVVSIYSLSKRNMERQIYGELRLAVISAAIVLHSASSRDFSLSFCFPVPAADSCGLKSCHTSISVTHIELSETSTWPIFSQPQSCLPAHGFTAAVCMFLSFLGLFCKRVSQSVPVHSLHLHNTLSGKNIPPSVIPRLLCKDLPSHCLERAGYRYFHPVLAPCVSGCSHSA